MEIERAAYKSATIVALDPSHSLPLNTPLTPCTSLHALAQEFYANFWLIRLQHTTKTAALSNII